MFPFHKTLLHTFVNQVSLNLFAIKNTVREKVMYHRYDSYDSNGRSTFVRSALQEEHGNSLKDGTAEHERQQNASQIMQSLHLPGASGLSIHDATCRVISRIGTERNKTLETEKDEIGD
jgi:hypothetical protein